MDFKIISKRLLKKKFETSVNIPFREDKRMHKLLECLSKQKYKDFVLRIANDSKKPYLKEKDFPKNISYIYYHSPNPMYSAYEKHNFLASVTDTPFIAIIESDCEPSIGWLSGLIPIIKKEKDNVVIKGCEARPLGCCTGNLIFPTKILQKVNFDTNAPITADYEMGLSLKEKGYELKMVNDRGLVFHNTISGAKLRVDRVILTAKEAVYLAFKYKDYNFLKRKFFRVGYYLFEGFAQGMAYLFYIPYFAIRSIFKNK